MKIGFFGSGNMANAIAEGIRESTPQCIFYFYSPTGNSSSKLAEKYNSILINDIDSMPKDLDWYFLAFKPQNLKDFNFKFSFEHKIVSILAGVKIEKLCSKFSVSKIIRLMPNTPIRVKKGLSLYFFNPNNYHSKEIEDFKMMFSKSGKLFITDSEAQLDDMTVFTGSGPALIFEMARIFELELKNHLKSDVQAHEIICQLFLGSSLLMSQEDQSFEDLKQQVTSKKGVTFAALSSLEQSTLDIILSNAFKSALKRVKELSVES